MVRTPEKQTNETNSDNAVDTIQTRFLRAAIATGALRFGEFTLKSGRLSPYFFNAGLFCSGKAITALSAAYADRLVASGLVFDVIFGPAYKGISLAATTAAQLYLRHGVDIGYCFNRKEAKDHGEGGLLVGAELKGRVLIIDDVISAGTSVRESVQIIRAAGAEPVGVLIALDRQERGKDAANPLSATQEVTAEFAIPVFAVATLADLLHFVDGATALSQNRTAILAYQQQFGAK
jgi:orotate phosphoribosyltransferase